MHTPRRRSWLQALTVLVGACIAPAATAQEKAAQPTAPVITPPAPADPEQPAAAPPPPADPSAAPPAASATPPAASATPPPAPPPPYAYPYGYPYGYAPYPYPPGKLPDRDDDGIPDMYDLCPRDDENECAAPRKSGMNGLLKAGIILTLVGAPVGAVGIAGAVGIKDEMLAVPLGFVGVLGSLSVLAGVPLMIIGATRPDPPARSPTSALPVLLVGPQRAEARWTF